MAMVFGVVSLSGPGLLLGIPATVMACIALKRQLPDRGLSIVGLVAGIVGTLLSLLVIVWIGVLVCIGITQPNPFDVYPYDGMPLQGSHEHFNT